MRYSLLSEHREILFREGCVEFEELCMPEEVAALRLAIDHATVGATSAMARFDHGFDLWRKEEVVSRIVHRRRLAEVAADLFQSYPLRLAFDQLLLPGLFLDQPPLTLEQISPIGQVVGGLILMIDEPVEEGSLGYPTAVGRGSFVRATTPISLTAPGRALLIVYCESRAQYLYNLGAPQLHRLKRLGYVFGDRLREDLHPTLVRKAPVA